VATRLVQETEQQQQNQQQQFHYLFAQKEQYTKKRMQENTGFSSTFSHAAKQQHAGLNKFSLKVVSDVIGRSMGCIYSLRRAVKKIRPINEQKLTNQGQTLMKTDER